MMRSLTTAKTGLEAQQVQLDVITHNLANGSTTGFKRGRAMFEDLMYQNIRQAGAPETQQTMLPTGLQVGTGVRAVATARNFSQGAIAPTGNPLDVAVNGPGFFQVQMPDGSSAYTRDGAFQVDAQGHLVTASGYAVLPAITVPAGALGVTIGRDGLVSAQMPGQVAPQQLGQLQLAQFTNPGGLEPRGGNLYAETAASGNPQTGNPGSAGLGVLQQSALEGSNVNIVEELVAMIQAQRAYEVNSKAIQTSDQMLARLAQL